MSDYYIGEIKPYGIIKTGFKGFRFKYKSSTMKSYKSKVRKIKKELIAERENMQEDFRNNMNKTNQALFQDIAEMALEKRSNAVGRKFNGIRQRSYENDERHYRLHLYPKFADVGIKSITTGLVNEFIEACANKDYSAKSIRHYVQTLSMIMKHAIDAGFIRRNPCNSDDRKEINGTSKDRGGYSHDHIGLILNVETNLYLKTFLMFSAFTGISANELQGLQWDDINFTQSEVTIKRNVYRYDAQELKNNFR